MTKPRACLRRKTTSARTSQNGEGSYSWVGSLAPYNSFGMMQWMLIGVLCFVAVLEKSCRLLLLDPSCNLLLLPYVDW